VEIQLIADSCAIFLRLVNNDTKSTELQKFTKYLKSIHELLFHELFPYVLSHNVINSFPRHDDVDQIDVWVKNKRLKNLSICI